MEGWGEGGAGPDLRVGVTALVLPLEFLLRGLKFCLGIFPFCIDSLVSLIIM